MIATIKPGWTAPARKVEYITAGREIVPARDAVGVRHRPRPPAHFLISWTTSTNDDEATRQATLEEAIRRLNR